MPAYEEGEASSNATSHHLENQNSNEYNHPRNFEEGGYGAPMPSYFTNNDQQVIIVPIASIYIYYFASYFICNRNISVTRVFVYRNTVIKYTNNWTHSVIMMTWEIITWTLPCSIHMGICNWEKKPFLQWVSYHPVLYPRYVLKFLFEVLITACFICIKPRTSRSVHP